MRQALLPTLHPAVLKATFQDASRCCLRKPAVPAQIENAKGCQASSQVPESRQTAAAERFPAGRKYHLPQHSHQSLREPLLADRRRLFAPSCLEQTSAGLRHLRSALAPAACSLSGNSLPEGAALRRSLNCNACPFWHRSGDLPLPPV